CRNNLKQIELGAHNFHSAYGKLPPGVLASNLPRDLNSGSPCMKNQWVGALAFLLPYIEQDNIYKALQVNWEIDSSKYNTYGTGSGPIAGAWYGNWWDNPINFQLARSRIPIFLCPSDNMGDAVPLYNVYCSFYAQ